MVPEIVKPRKVTTARVRDVEAAAGLPLPAAYAEFVRSRGCGEPAPSWVRLPDGYRTPLVPDSHVHVEQFLSPAKTRVGRTEVAPSRTFLAVATSGDYWYLLELTLGSGHGVYYWTRHPSESLDRALASTPDSVGMVSFVARVADGFGEFIQSFEARDPAAG